METVTLEHPVLHGDYVVKWSNCGHEIVIYNGNYTKPDAKRKAEDLSQKSCPECGGPYA